MTKKIQHSIYSTIDYLYGLLLLIIGFALFCLLHMLRIKILSYFEFNLFLYYMSAVIFFGVFMACIMVFRFFHNILKEKCFSKFEKYRKPTYSEIYGEDYPEPIFSDFNLTREEFIELLRSDKKNPKVKAYKNSLKIYHKINNDKWLKSQ